MKEIWKPVVGWEDTHLVSNLGRVKSVPRVRKYSDGRVYSYPGKILSQCNDGGGYIVVGLKKRPRKETGKVHRMVAQAFISNPENKPQINHKNGIRTDNRVDNLEWATASENLLHSFRCLNRKPFSLSGKNNIRSKRVAQYTVEGEFVREYESANMAAKGLGLDNSSISRVARGEYKTAGGFKWKYVSQ